MVASSAPKSPFFVVAHMANTIRAVEWAMAKGASALEMDIRFDVETGKPSHFLHGGVCDCSCSPWCLMLKNGDPGDAREDICSPLSCDCNATEDSSKQFAFLAKQPKLSLIILDSKVSGNMPEKFLETAGRAIIEAIDEELFGAGYPGCVVISSGHADAFTYLQSAAAAARAGRWSDRTFFALDETGGKSSQAFCSLEVANRLPTTALAYGTGISACIPGTFTDAIETAVMNREKGATGFVYIWTLDRRETMKKFLGLGVDAILTNLPDELLGVALAAGVQISTPGTPIPLSESRAIGDPETCSCDCDYHPGGCRISFPAPRNKACHCVYEALRWTCKGRVEECLNASSPFCMIPDSSVPSCHLGGGDCSGYQ